LLETAYRIEAKDEWQEGEEEDDYNRAGRPII